MPIFAGAEIILAFLAVRILVWVVRGWRDFELHEPPPGPGGPGGGRRLALVQGEGRRSEELARAA